jgi:purine-binding chemotaxis protein CheW
MQTLMRDVEDGTREVVSFKLGEQDFCIEIGLVREIRGWTQTTVIPHAQDYINGIINLRGSVVAVVDLAARLGLGVTTPSPRHVIIIVSLGSQIVGLLAEVVSDILTVTPDMVKSVPDQITDQARDFITCILTFPNGLILRGLDLSHILPASEACST